MANHIFTRECKYTTTSPDRGRQKHVIPILSMEGHENMTDLRRGAGVYIEFPGDEKAFGGCLSSGRGFLHVSASGDVEPCPFAPYLDSSIRDMPLKEALNSRLFTVLQENRDQLMESNGGCALWKKSEWVKSLMDQNAV